MTDAIASEPAFPWGAPPSARYEALAEPFRAVFARIREGAVERDLKRRLPHEEIGWLREAGFPRVRLPRELGGQGATLTELFALLVELGAADTNVVNALRAHLGFVEDVLNSREKAWRARWLDKLAQGDLIGSGASEAGDAKVGSFSTRLLRGPQGLRLNGQKFYTTGSLFADWINVVADDDEGEVVYLQVPRSAPGVEVVDDWNGFGQSLTASGTAHFADVAVEPEWLNPAAARFAYATPFFQLVHLASLTGIGRALADDLAQRVRQRDRAYSHGNAARVADDPQILQVVGRARAAAYGAGAIAQLTSASLQRSLEANTRDDASDEERQRAALEAHVEVDQAVSLITRLVLDASTELFDALGASATLRPAGLDRYWRNARTISSHNPRVYRERQVGAFAVSGTTPPTFYRIGKA
ncbi:acyl-CoA dehydrogenase family protein [Variovorax fucosicus]|uniref:acyl-CoA dehydrogenase family protein n=1 Tax=Variovorax fucosicus TaxID=3053517 RepID=UPI0025762BBD|nr:acyl-CoA dehydrogenase family protein [Variovorax sp. J22G47]MDM0059069.1 acyl-CoA dehydrogenase family protein [Variovorax sp. J22G47]